MNLERVTGPVLSLFRIVVGLLFLSHGLASIFGLFGGVRGTGRTVEFATWPSWWAALIQVVGGALVALGLGTRVAALISSGSMAYAYFVVHQPEGAVPLTNGGEAAAMFCWSFFLLAVLGPGPWALDALLSRSRTGSRERAPATA
jgi:putative oxidoreductase